MRVVKGVINEVLGVTIGRHYASSESIDFNDIPVPIGIKMDTCGSTGNMTNAPSFGWGTLISVNPSGGQKSQLFINGTYFQWRHKDGDNNWGSWNLISSGV